MNQKWNLQDIRPAEPKRKRPAPHNTESKSTPNSSGESVPVTDRRKRSRKVYIYIFAAIFVVVAGAIFLSQLMAGADVTVYPKHSTPTINSTITAYPEQRTGELAYEVMTLTASDEAQVTATGETQVEERATGMIEIIKSTPGNQQLVEETRFESPDGLIYRTTEGVTVPGATSDGAGTTPGTVRVEVVAAEPGEEYNLAAGTRFTIPGFAEGGFDDLFDAMYGENRGQISGGYEGPRYDIADSELSEARQELQLTLRENLLDQMQSEKPANFLLFPSAASFTYEQLPAAEYGDNLVTIKEEATLYIPIFNSDDFAAYLAEAALPTYNRGESIRVDNADALSLEYESSTTTQANLEQLSSLTFTLTGNAELVWTYNLEEFKNELANERKEALRFVVDEYVAIERADARIQPFWSQTYPSDTSLITVTERIE